MAVLNSYDWVDPDPYVAGGKSIDNARVIGEIQYFYKNTLRSKWFTPIYWNASQIDVWEEDSFGPGGPFTNGDERAWKGVGLNVTFPGDVVVPDANGLHLHGYDALYIARYLYALYQTKRHIASFYGHNWEWYNSVANLQVNGINFSDFTSNEPPKGKKIQLLRECPTTELDFITSTTNYSIVNPTGEMTNNDSVEFNDYVPTTPSGMGDFARETKILNQWSIYTATFPLSLTIFGSDNDNSSSGRVGIFNKSHTNPYSGSAFGLNNNTIMDLPLNKRTLSTLSFNQGLLNNDETDDLNGVILTPLIGIRFSTFSAGKSIGSFAQRYWRLYITTSNYPNSASSIEEEIYKYAENYDDIVTTRPVGAFTQFNQDNITLYPGVDYPAKLGKTISKVSLRIYSETNGITAQTIELKAHYVKGINIIFDI
jgi:hypothetical protein